MTALATAPCQRCGAPTPTDQLVKVRTWRGPRQLCQGCQAIWARLGLTR